MKKIILAAVILVVLATFACTAVACKGGDELLLYVPDGAPALSVAKIINDGAVGDAATKQAVRTVIADGNEVIAKCSSGEADMAVLPTNAAVKICSARDDYMLFSVNVYGVLYIVGTRQVTSLKDLQGERLYSIGLGNTPQYVFQTICDAQGVNYREYDGESTLYGEIMIKYFNDAQQIIPQVLNGTVQFALLGEPAASQLVGKLLSAGKTAYSLFDLQQLWQQTTKSEQAGYPQASLIVKKELFANDNFRRMLNESLSANAQFLNKNADNLKNILQSAGSALTVDFNVELLARCNLTYVSGYQAKADIETYLGKFKDMQQYLPLKNEIFQLSDSAE